MTVYTIRWRQTYVDWQPWELPITDLSAAQAVIKRIQAFGKK